MPGLLSETKRQPIINMKPMHFKNIFTCKKKKITNQKACTVTAAQCCQIENTVISTGNPIISFNITYKTWTMPWFRWLATSLSLQRPRFNPRPVHTAHVDKMAAG